MADDNKILTTKQRTTFVYILKCADGTYYTGSTNNIVQRISAHNGLKSGAKYTKTRRPVELVYQEAYKNLSLALKREIEIKKLTRVEKERLIRKISAQK